MNTTPPELLSQGPLPAIERAIKIKEAAEIAGTCTRTIWREIERGKLAAVKYSKNRTRILASELSRYLGGEAA